VKRGRFRLGRAENGQGYIYAPDGRPVLHYWFFWGARLGNHKEWNLWLMDDAGEDIEQLAAIHGGYTRSTVHYLNTGAFFEPYHAEEFLSKQAVSRLDELRSKYLDPQPTPA
jgi:hypothetical protein